MCERHRGIGYYGGNTPIIETMPEVYGRLVVGQYDPVEQTVTITMEKLSDEKAFRKTRPVYSGVLKYFPDALLEVANISFIGNEQHNPGEPLHWARHKSTDQLDAAVRHILDDAMGIEIDTDGGYHLAKAAWRILAELQLRLETKKGTI